MRDEARSDAARIDRALPTLLADELAGRVPPDLTARILAAAGTGPATLPRIVARRGVARGRRRRVALVASFLVGAAATAALLWTGAPDPAAREPAVVTDARLQPVEVRVLAGAVQLAAAGSPARHPAAPTATLRRRGETFAWTPRPGDRLDAAGGRPLLLELRGLGRLSCAAATCVEVEDVDWKRFASGFVAGSITVTTIFGAATWSGTEAGPDQTTAAPIVLASDRSHGAGAAVTLTAEPQSAELAAARQRIAELEARLQARTAVAVPDAAPVRPLATGAAFDDLLREVDWSQVGEAVDGYLDAALVIEALIAAGEPVPMELRAKADRWEGLLFEQLGDVLEAGVPGETVTARIHHPAIMANMLMATMAACGTALDEDQLRRCAEMGRRYAAEDAARRDGYGDATLDLTRFVDEIELQERFFAEQRGLLTRAQEQRISFGDLAERASVDPFGSGYQWSKNNRPVEAASRQALATRAADGFASDLGLDADQRARLAEMTSRWASRLPQQWLDRPMDDLDRSGRMHIERIRGAARLQLELMAEMARGLLLTPEQLARLRGVRTVFVPFLRP